MIAGILSLILGFIELLVGLRFVLRLFGANPNSGFVEWVYSWSAPLVTPFANVFGQEVTVAKDVGVVVSSVFDWTALVALVVYAIVGGIVVRLVSRD